MSFEFSLAHLTVLELAPIDLLKAAEAAGYDYFSPRLVAVTGNEPHHPLVHDKARLRELTGALKQSRVKVNDVELASLRPQTRPESFLPVFETAQALSARFVITQLPDDDRNRALEKFQQFCELARQYSLRPMLEFTSWSQIPDFKAAKQMLEKSGMDNAGMLVDVLHVSRSHTEPQEFAAAPPSWFGFVHLCDASGPVPASREAQIFTAREDRVPPGLGDINVADILRALPVIPYSLEIPNSRVRQMMGAGNYAAYCLEKTREYLESHLSRLQAAG